MGNKYYNDINYRVVKMSYRKNCLSVSYRHPEFKQQKKLMRTEEDFSEAIYELLEKEKGGAIKQPPII